MHDAPAYDPSAAAYLLTALVPECQRTLYVWLLLILELAVIVRLSSCVLTVGGSSAQKTDFLRFFNDALIRRISGRSPDDQSICRVRFMDANCLHRWQLDCSEMKNRLVNLTRLDGN